MIIRFTVIVILKTFEWMALFVEVWRTGIYYFHFMIFIHFCILKPFFANIFDWMLFGHISWGV